MVKTPNRSQALFLLMLAVGAWGALLALGALLFGYRGQVGGVGLSVDVRRGLIVLACVSGFLGMWAAALWLRSRRGGEPTDSNPATKSDS